MLDTRFHHSPDLTSTSARIRQKSINGRTQCQFSWANTKGGTVNEQTGWFHDILYPDGKPYRQDEIEAIKANLKP